MSETKTTPASVPRPGRVRGGSTRRLGPAAEDYARRARAGDGPAWRWSRAQGLVTLGERPDQLDDPATVAAWAFCSAVASGDAAAGGVPDGTPAAAMSQAYGLYAENGPRRWQAEAWLLAGLAVEAVATRVGVAAAVVGAYADAFFDVVGRRRAGDWIWAYAVRVGPRGPAEPTEADVWRYAAAAGGPAVLDVVIGDYLSLPDPLPTTATSWPRPSARWCGSWRRP